MLQLQIAFPSGRYHASDPSDPRRPEWPPHPSRVYSALVAAAYAGGRTPSDVERHALHSIESAPPPALSFPDADNTPAPDTFVPVNDERSRIDASMVKGKLKTKTRGILHPNRQVRQFPSAFLLGRPEVSLVWPIEVDEPQLVALDDLAARVTHVGTSQSLAVARFARLDAALPARFAPVEAGAHFLRVPRPGRLDELDQLASQGHGIVRRPHPACEELVPYGPAVPVEAAPPPAYDWVALRASVASWGADTAHTMARATRAAVMAILGDAAPAAVHGHDPDLVHVAWLPLPDVGHPFARGRIRGLAVAIPMTVLPQDRALALAGLFRLQVVHLPDGQQLQVEASIDGPDTPLVLRTSTWCEPSTWWSTVTPVLLDRPPKRLEPDRIQEALVESIVNAGFPIPIEVRVSQTSDFEGAPGALEVPTQVPRFHARVEFDRPVCGPVLAGRWRNFGVGLFRPTPQELRR